MPDGHKRDDIKVGYRVKIVKKENQGKGTLTEGVIAKILTNAKEHPHGIKVELQDGSVGRVKEIMGDLDGSVTVKEVAISQLQDVDEKALQAMLLQGENQHTEFKSSFCFDIKKFKMTGIKEKNREVEKTIAKSIASFMNASGGNTLIGVNNEGKILGIKEDLALMHKHDTDTFRLHLKNSLESFLTNKIIFEHLKIEFPSIEGIQICLVRATPSPEPVFVNDGGGRQLCYVRVDNESKPFQYDEFLRYWQRRKPENN